MQINYDALADLDLPMVQGNTYEVTHVYKRRVWEFPKERFVTYEPSDEAWARPLGFGREVVREERLAIPNAVLTRLDHGGATFRGVPSRD